MSENDPREWQRNMGIKPASDNDVFGAINNMPPEDEVNTAEIPVVNDEAQSQPHQKDAPTGNERQSPMQDVPVQGSSSNQHTGDTVTKDVLTLSEILPRLKMPLHKGLYFVVALVGAFVASLVFPLIITIPLSFLFWPNIIAQEEQGRRKNAIGCFVLMFVSALFLSVFYTIIVTTIRGLFTS